MTISLSFTHFSFADDVNHPIILLPDQGPIKGSLVDDLVVFKGIPYATPPIGEKRWFPPQPPISWKNIRDATQFAPDCSQKPNHWDIAKSRAPFSEDCLYLNIWAPKDFLVHQNENTYPVMVWIHGGGFVTGGSSPAVYDGSNLARQGVIVVSFNYRLGRFGFFAHPALHQENEETEWANYGLMDQIAALKWIKKYISTFGGNQQNITLFGESAGGASILALLTTPDADDLFDKAIIESGTSHSTILPPLPWQEAAKLAENFALKHKITGTQEDIIKQLRQLSAEEIIDGLNLEDLQPDTFSGLMIDGVLLKTSLGKAFKEGKFRAVPLLIGANDGDSFFQPGTTTETLAQQLGTTSNAIQNIYNPDGKMTDNKVSRQVLADIQMIEPAREVAKQMFTKDVPVYEYRFSYIPKPARPYTSYGAPHASEVPFVFDHLDSNYKQVDPQDEAMAKAISTYWVNFARNGIPTAEGFPSAPLFDPNHQQILHFSMQGPKVEVDPFQKQLDFIKNLQKKKPLPSSK